MCQEWDGELTNKAEFWQAAAWFHFLYGRVGEVLSRHARQRLPAHGWGASRFPLRRGHG
jgi:hypothetical protein